jgi:DNA-binding CsgD family transcriptional regulator
MFQAPVSGRPGVGRAAQGTIGRVATPHVIGRARELAAIERVMDAAEDGVAGLILDGDPGIGKTTLFEAAVARAMQRMWHVLATRPTAGDAGLSFTGLIDLLDGVDDTSLDELPPPQRSSLEVALLRRGNDEPAEPGAVAVATVRVLRGLARARPVLIAIDDLQWLDRPTLRTLEFAVRRLRSEPVLVLVSQRPGGSAVDALGASGAVRPAASPSIPAVESMIAALGDSAITRLRVEPLSIQTLYQLLHERLGLTLGHPALVRVHEASGGNPFFALELARALIESAGRVVAGRPLPVPERLHDLLRQRLGRLPARTRRVLLGAAAMGAPELDELRAAFDLSAGPGLPDELERAERAGVIELRASVVCFTHPLLAASVYSTATPAELRRLHRGLADTAGDLESRARHLALSKVEADEEVAAVLDLAATSAIARGATDVAAQFAEQAFALTPVGGHGACRRALEAGSLALAAGDQVRGRELFELALELAAPGPQRAEGLLRLAEVAEPLQAGIAMCDRALSEDDLEQALQSRLHRVRARISYFIGDVGNARLHAEEGVDLATNAGDPLALGMATAELAHWTFCGGGGVRRELFERAVALDGSAGADAPRSHFAKILMDSGQLGEARLMLERLIDEATARGDLRALATHELHLAELEVLAGHLTSALDHADESLLLRQHVDRPAAPRYIRGMALACLGRAREARDEAQAGLAEAERTDDVIYRMANLHVLGFIELSAEQYGPAHEHLGLAVDLLRPRWNREFGDCHFVPDEIEAAIALGELDRARDLVGWMDAVGQSTRRPWTLATSARCRALLLAADGDLEGAIVEIGRALAEHKRVGMPLELGRTLLVNGIIQRRRRQWAAAQAALRQAEEQFVRLGAATWTQRARSALARIGERSRAHSALTPVEEQIAGLVAEGRTNREIADRLFVSPKTIEATLTHIYRKLEIRTRTELAAAMSRGAEPRI